jgi:hypothetical protein
MGEEDGVHATDPPTISQLLAKWHDGDHEALRALFPLLYEDLRYVAHQSLCKARPGHTLQTTAPPSSVTGRPPRSGFTAR